VEALEQRHLPSGIYIHQWLDFTNDPSEQITITADPPSFGVNAKEFVQVGSGTPQGFLIKDIWEMDILLPKNGANVIVKSTNIQTELIGQTPANKITDVTVMTNGKTSQSDANIWGHVDVTNPPGYTHLAVQSTASQGQIGTFSVDPYIGIGYIEGLTPADITYQQDDLSDLLVQGGNGGNTFNVSDTGRGWHHDWATTLNVGSGLNTVNVEGTTGTLQINRQGGNNDVINISLNAQNLDKINGDVRVIGSSNHSTLNVYDHNNPLANDYWMNAGVVSARPYGGNVYYDHTNLYVYGGSGDNHYYIIDSQAGTTTTLFTGVGTDKVNVGDANGTLNVNTGDGNNDEVNVQDTHATLNVNVGGGNNDVVDVEQTRSVGSVLVNLGSGFDTVYITEWGQNLDTISGNVFVFGGLGSATLIVDDQSNAQDSPYTMMSTGEEWLVERPHRVDMGGFARIYYRLIPAVDVNGGSGANTYNVMDTEGGAKTTLNTGNGNDIVNVENTTGSLDIHLGSGSNTVNITPTGQDLSQIAGSVSINETAGTATINLHDELFNDPNDYTIDGTRTRVGRLGAAFDFTYSGISHINLYYSSGTLVWP
jgi:hypothetical protein